MFANDADYCRHKGWVAGTVLHLIEDSYRITAVGEQAILVRRLNVIWRWQKTENAERRWVRTLIGSEIVRVTT